MRANESAATPIVGVIGSWGGRRSNRSRPRTCRILKIALGLRTMLGSAPFAGTITDRPIGVTWPGGCSCRPCRGCRYLVRRPGGSCPIRIRASTPSFSRARAWWSACSGTPPQNDHEYGTTIRTFSCRDHARFRARELAASPVPRGGPTRLRRLCVLVRLCRRSPLIDARACEGFLVDVPRLVAGRQVPVAVVDERRLDLGTDVGRIAAPRVEAPPRGR